jgi:inosine/xanthosine triphosphate pyrophosphatase family protein
MKLLIATWNPSKLQMFQSLLCNLKNIELLSLSNFESIDDPIEDWKTVQENALIKAKYYSEVFKIPTLADDAWFEVEDLWWAPWVMARRWWWELHNSISDEDYLEFFLNKISHIDKERLNACFPFSRCLYLPSGEYSFQNERIDIVIWKEPRRPYKQGWPMSALTYLHDWRHHLDISNDDPIFEERLKKEGLIELISKHLS